MSFLQHYATYRAKLISDVRESLLNETAQAVSDVMAQKLMDNVYSYQASPRAMESRRYDEGGLLDPDNVSADVSGDKDLTLTVSNNAPFQDASLNGSGHSLTEVVQEGLSGYRQPGPRPFMADTESECISSGRALKAFNEGMRKRGQDIKKIRY